MTIARREVRLPEIFHTSLGSCRYLPAREYRPVLVGCNPHAARDHHGDQHGAHGEIGEEKGSPLPETLIPLLRDRRTGTPPARRGNGLGFCKGWNPLDLRNIISRCYCRCCGSRLPRRRTDPGAHLIAPPHLAHSGLYAGAVECAAQGEHEVLRVVLNVFIHNRVVRILDQCARVRVKLGHPLPAHTRLLDLPCLLCFLT
jgi:hypothetical protein